MGKGSDRGSPLGIGIIFVLALLIAPVVLSGKQRFDSNPCLPNGFAANIDVTINQTAYSALGTAYQKEIDSMKELKLEVQYPGFIITNVFEQNSSNIKVIHFEDILKVAQDDHSISLADVIFSSGNYFKGTGALEEVIDVNATLVHVDAFLQPFSCQLSELQSQFNLLRHGNNIRFAACLMTAVAFTVGWIIFEKLKGCIFIFWFLNVVLHIAANVLEGVTWTAIGKATNRDASRVCGSAASLGVLGWKRNMKYFIALTVLTSILLVLITGFLWLLRTELCCEQYNKQSSAPTPNPIPASIAVAAVPPAAPPAPGASGGTSTTIPVSTALTGPSLVYGPPPSPTKDTFAASYHDVKSEEKCIFSREDLHALLVQSEYGSRKAIFDTYFLEGPVCATCMKPLEVHPSGAPVVQPSEPSGAQCQTCDDGEIALDGELVYRV